MGQIAVGLSSFPASIRTTTRDSWDSGRPRNPSINIDIAASMRRRAESVQRLQAFADIPATRPDKQMIEIARKIIEQREGDFEPEKFEDRYENALRDLIRRKERGEKLVTAEPVEESNVIDLMDALKKSLKAKGRSVPAKAPAPKRRSRKA